MEKQQKTTEKQELASKVSHLSEKVHLRLRCGLMSWGWGTAGQTPCLPQNAVSFSLERQHWKEEKQ